MPKSHTSVLQDFLALGNAALVPDPEGAEYLGGLVARINQDIPNMTPQARRDFYNTEAGQGLFREVQDTLGVQRGIQDQEEQPTDLQTIILQRQQEAVADAAIRRAGVLDRHLTATANAEMDPTAILQPVRTKYGMDMTNLTPRRRTEAERLQEGTSQPVEAIRGGGARVEIAPDAFAGVALGGGNKGSSVNSDSAYQSGGGGSAGQTADTASFGTGSTGTQEDNPDVV